MFKRARQDRLPDPIVKAFARTALLVDETQRALVAAIPTSRDPGTPLNEALDAFAQKLDMARASMTAWRDDRVSHEWTKCEEAIDRARAAATDLRLEQGLTFEQLNARVGDVLYPLESFADVERELRRR